jgi:predicted amino acid racemase
LREGVLPSIFRVYPASHFFIPYKNCGIGCNLACYGGVKPADKNMHELSELFDVIEKEFHLGLTIISGGNSANYEWYKSTKDVGNINNLRLGESILLGLETVNRKTIPGLHTGAFQLVAEVIESKKKPSLPFGEIGQDAFGNVPAFQDQGIHQRVIIALGKQDVLVSSLKSNNSLKYWVLAVIIPFLSKNKNLKVGDEVNFNLDYGGLLAAMTSPFIKKHFVNGNDHPPAEYPYRTNSGPQRAFSAKPSTPMRREHLM